MSFHSCCQTSHILIEAVGVSTIMAPVDRPTIRCSVWEPDQLVDYYTAVHQSSGCSTSNICQHISLQELRLPIYIEITSVASTNDGCHEGELGGMRGGPEVLEGGAENLLPSFLAVLVRYAQHMTYEGRVTLAIRQLIRIHIANGTNDGLHHKRPDLLTHTL